MAEQIKNEEMENEADLTAASDSISTEETELPKLNFVVKFKRPYKWDDEEIKELDLSGLNNLTTIDAQEIERTMSRLNHTIQGSKFQDTLYCKHVAMRVTGKSADFFNMLRMVDMEEIKGRIMLFFIYG